MFLKTPGSVSWLLVFLGNPGPKYDCTRHNAGFMAGDALGRGHGVGGHKARVMPGTFVACAGIAQKDDHPAHAAGRLKQSHQESKMLAMETSS